MSLGKKKLKEIKNMTFVSIIVIILITMFFMGLGDVLDKIGNGLQKMILGSCGLIIVYLFYDYSKGGKKKK